MTKKDKNKKTNEYRDFEATGSMYHEERAKNVEGYGEIDPNAEELNEDLS